MLLPRLTALAPLALLIAALPAPAHAQSMADNPTIKALLADPQYVALDARANAGDPAAMVELARLVHDRLTGPTKIGFGDIALKRQLKLLSQAMALGYAPAMKEMGDMTLIGDGLPQNKEVAREFYRMAAEKGDVQSIKLAAELHLNDESPLYSQRHAQQAMQGPRSTAEILEDLKRPDDDNDYVWNGDEAVRLLTMPAARGDVEARRMLASAYLNEKQFKQGAQPEKALEVLMELIKREDPRDYRMLGELYATGYAGFPADPAKAALYFGQAAMNGDGLSAWSLGFMYVLGKGVPQDNLQAFANFQKSAAAGYAKGMTSLGVCYLEGRGTAKNEAAAAEWFEKAADAGDGEGAFYLGELWKDGVDGTRNSMRAWLAYKRGAELGNEKAKAAFATFKPN